MPLQFILFTLVFSLHHAPASCGVATDTMSAGQLLTAGDKIVSSDGKFALGFFHTGDKSLSATLNWYVGIWFNKVPKLTPVWVANRQDPVRNPAMHALTILSDGSLVILNQATMSKIWSSSSSRSIAGRDIASNSNGTTTIAVLLNTGNLVLLQDSSNTPLVLWQSFDFPTDVFLPGAKLGRDKVTGLIRRLVSRKNLIDLAPGPYCSELDPSGAHQIVNRLCNSSIVYWSSGEWNGQYFSSVPEMSHEVGRSGIYSSVFVDNDQEEYHMYAVTNHELITFGYIDVSGQGKQLIWHEGSDDWLLVSNTPKAPCDVYGVCGPFTICTDNMVSLCNCMMGFSVRSQTDWELDDRTGGCVRNFRLDDCGSNQSSSVSASSTDKIYPISGVALPNNGSIVEAAAGADQCEQACLRNCSCTAYSYGSRCTIWHAELLNVRKQQQDIGSASINGVALYIRLAAKEVQSWRSNRKEIAIGASAGAGLLLLFIVVVLLVMMLWRRNRRLLKNIQHGGSIVAFRYTDLSHATKMFSDKLGSGGFGSVYKGFLSDSTTIAVKRLDGANQGEKQFRAEVSSIGIIQHINLVKLIGFCCEGDKRLLVYEHMPNGSLDAHLFQNNAAVLNWSSRYQIALGVARGLAYLHESCRDCIIHCDIKPDNILLDASFIPKIADFGMAKIAGRDFSKVLTTMRGTRGYLAPEWISGMAITSKVDVYSFGMVLFEIISGRRNSGGKHSCSDHATFFPMQARHKLLEGDVKSLLDDQLCGNANLEEAERVCNIACWCIQDDELNRPTMGKVVKILEGLLELDMPPVPRLLQAILGTSCSPCAYSPAVVESVIPGHLAKSDF